MVYCTGNKLVVERSTVVCSSTVDIQLVLYNNTAVDTPQQVV